MKKVLIYCALLALTSCASDKYLLTPEQMKNSPYSKKGFNIMKGDEIIGKVTSTEIEIDKKGRVVKEISITLTGFEKLGEAEEVIKYLHTSYPDKKIEINLDGIVTFD